MPKRPDRFLVGRKGENNCVYGKGIGGIYLYPLTKKEAEGQTPCNGFFAIYELVEVKKRKIK